MRRLNGHRRAEGVWSTVRGLPVTEMHEMEAEEYVEVEDCGGISRKRSGTGNHSIGALASV